MALINQQPDTYIRRQLIEETFGKVGVGTYIEPMIQFDYGYNISVEKISMPILITFFRCLSIEIGDNCMFGPNVQLYTAEHPLQAPSVIAEWNQETNYHWQQCLDWRWSDCPSWRNIR